MKTPVLFDVPITGKRISKRKAPSVERIKVNHELAKKRYYFHRRLKGIFPLDGTLRTIDASPYRSFEEIPKPYRYYVGQLIEMGYNAQYKLL